MDTYQELHFNRTIDLSPSPEESSPTFDSTKTDKDQHGNKGQPVYIHHDKHTWPVEVDQEQEAWTDEDSDGDESIFGELPKTPNGSTVDWGTLMEQRSAEKAARRLRREERAARVADACQAGQHPLLTGL